MSKKYWVASKAFIDFASEKVLRGDDCVGNRVCNDCGVPESLQLGRFSEMAARELSYVSPTANHPPGESTAMHITKRSKILVDPKTNKPMPKGVKFKFTGSAPSKAEPGKEAKAFGADNTGSLIMLFPVDAETVFQSTLTMKEEKYLKLDVKKDTLPKEGDPVKLVLEVAGK